MSPDTTTPVLILGPMLRFISDTEATIWLEADRACRVEVLGHGARTFQVHGRHYAIVAITELEPATSIEYEVLLDGVCCWPETGTPWPPSRVRTLPRSGPVDLVFGSCRVSRPHRPPYTLSPDHHELGTGVDTLYALAVRMRDQDPERCPSMLLLLGDQVYADEIPPETAAFIRSRRDITTPPRLEVADFEEYAELHREAWADPPLRWLLSTLPTAMIFDDHDVHDDWNTSAAWVTKMHAEAWWTSESADRYRDTRFAGKARIVDPVGGFPATRRSVCQGAFFRRERLDGLGGGPCAESSRRRA